MKKHLFIFTIFIITGVFALAQLPDDFPVIDKADLPGAEFELSRIYTGSSLFGYIDGGAELYLEYGFSVVSVTEIKYSGGTYKTEIYKMNGSEEAFGIFSVSRYRCNSLPDLTGISCLTKYQLQICRGNYYISIINRTGTSNDSIASIKIGRAITARIEGDDVNLKKYFPDIDSQLLNRSCVLAKGKLGIVNGSPDLEDFFGDFNDFTAVILKGEKTNISVIFRNSDTLNKFSEFQNLSRNKSDTRQIVRKVADCHLLIELSD